MNRVLGRRCQVGAGDVVLNRATRDAHSQKRTFESRFK